MSAMGKYGDAKCVVGDGSLVGQNGEERRGGRGNKARRFQQEQQD